jgi:hypothetical protein
LEEDALSYAAPFDLIKGLCENFSERKCLIAFLRGNDFFVWSKPSVKTF